MKKIIILLHVLFLYLISISQNIKIYGYISDKITGEKIINALVIVDDKKNVYSNEFGYYSIDVKKDAKLKIHFKYLGYKDTIIEVNTITDRQLDVLLEPNNQIGMIEIYGKRNNTNSYIISSKEIKLLPSILGEHDIIKGFQMMPGVQFGIDGTSDIYVRGGSSDQNMILIDDIPLQFTNHIGSFVSIFDVNAINTAKLYVYGFPSKYAGSLSSIIDIRIKDGNLKRLEGEISVGLISSKISLNGPIKKNKISFVSTLRLCNLGLFSYPANYFYPQVISYAYYFYDINFKINYLVSKNNKIDFTIYNGMDMNIFRYNNLLDSNKNKDISKTNIFWGNFLVSARWTHNYSKSLFQKIVLGFTSFNYSSIYKNTFFENSKTILFREISYFSNVSKFIFKLDYDYFVNTNNKLNFGLQFYKHTYNPGNNLYVQKYLYGDTNTLTFSYPKEKPFEINFYEDYSVNFNHFSFNLGFLFNVFYNQKVFKNYFISTKITYFINKFNNLCVSFDKTYQNYHLLTNSYNIIPSDIWVPAVKNAPPESSLQYSFSYLFSKNNKLNFNFSIFYKIQNNLIEYGRYNFKNDTAQIPLWHNTIVNNGKGNIYGVEIMINKNVKRFSLQISYTLMYNYRIFKEINFGEPYPFKFDRRHFLQSIFMYKFSESLNIQAIFVYGSGFPITINYIAVPNIMLKEPFSIESDQSNNYSINQNYSSSFEYSSYSMISPLINAYRLPDYHRLDLAINWSKQKKLGVRTWSLNFINLYNHLNVSYIGITTDNITGKAKLLEGGLIPFIASISYSYKF